MLIKLYADAPNYRDLTELVEALRNGAVIIYPTNTGYAYCCDALQVRSIEEICKLKGIDPKKKSLALMFRDLSQLSTYCKLNDETFKFIKGHNGEYTFILPSASTLPKIFKNRKEVGARLVQNDVARLLLEELGNPLITSSLPIDDTDPEYSTNPELVMEHFGTQVKFVIDAGIVGRGPSTIIDCMQEPFEVVRLGEGSLDQSEFIN